MNRPEYLLTCLAEECSEVSQRISKALRFGLDEIQTGQSLNNEERILDEFIDLLAVMEILNREGVLASPMITEDDIQQKQTKIEKYLEISRKQGTYQE